MSDNQDKLEGLHQGEERIAASPPAHSEPRWGTASPQAGETSVGAGRSESNAEKLTKLQEGRAASSSAAGGPPNSPHNWGSAIGSATLPPAGAPANRKRNGLLVGLGGVVTVALLIGLLGYNLSGNESSDVASDPISAEGESPEPGGTVPETTTEAGEELFAPPASKRDLIKQVTASTVYIECDARGGNGGWSGSGFALDQSSLTGSSESIVITNNHVIEDCVTQVDVIANGQTMSGSVIGGDADVDLAVIRVSNLTVPPLSPNLSPERGQWVMAAGAPESIRDSIDEGTVNNVLDADYQITSDVVIAHGSSGGPLVNSRGEVIGANSGVVLDSEDGSVTRISLAQQIRGLCVTLLTCR